jgi:hypothetical protein
MLPETGAAVLAEGTPTANSHDQDASCTDLSTAQARTLATALDNAGTRRNPSQNLQPDYDLVDAGGQNAGSIMFTPYLPHGEAPCIACG